MYKIEWIRGQGSVFSELNIDNHKVHSDCQKYATHANNLEEKLKRLLEMFPDGMEHPFFIEVKKLVYCKWVSEAVARSYFKNPAILDELIKSGMLGFSMEGEERIFDMHEIIMIKTIMK